MRHRSPAKLGQIGTELEVGLIRCGQMGRWWTRRLWMPADRRIEIEAPLHCWRASASRQPTDESSTASWSSTSPRRARRAHAAFRSRLASGALRGRQPDSGAGFRTRDRGIEEAGATRRSDEQGWGGHQRSFDASDLLLTEGSALRKAGHGGGESIRAISLDGEKAEHALRAVQQAGGRRQLALGIGKRDETDLENSRGTPGTKPYAYLRGQ